MVAKKVKFTLVVISVSVTLICVMVFVGEINFFEGMSCEQLEKYVSEIPRGKYPFGTPFTPSQIDYLDNQYDIKCGVKPSEELVHHLIAEDVSLSYDNLFHEGVSDYELTSEINNIDV